MKISAIDGKTGSGKTNTLISFALMNKSITFIQADMKHDAFVNRVICQTNDITKYDIRYRTIDIGSNLNEYLADVSTSVVAIDMVQLFKIDDTPLSNNAKESIDLIISKLPECVEHLIVTAPIMVQPEHLDILYTATWNQSK